MLKKIAISIMLPLATFAQSSEEVLMEFFEKYDISVCVYHKYPNYSVPGCVKSEGFLKEFNISDIYSFYSDNPNINIEFPPEIELLANLERVSIYNYHGDTIKGLENLKRAPKLKSLMLSTSTPKDFSPIFEIKSLESLQIYSKLESIPEGIGKLQNLKALDLSGNNFTAINDELYTLKKLESLNLSDNNITLTSENINKFKNLKSLKISNTNIESVNLDLNLTELYVNNSHVKSIDMNKITGMSELVRLNLNDNGLDISKDVEKISNLTKLQELKINHSNINNIDWISKLVSLVTIDLSSNNIESIPSGIANLTMVNYLNLGKNNIKKIPKEIGNVNTEHMPCWGGCIYIGLSLLIDNNRISHFPKELCGFEGFTDLSIANNLSNSLPECVKKMQVMHLLDGNGSTIAWSGTYFTPLKFFTDNNLSLYTLQLNHTYQNDNKTISFTPILGDDYNISTYTWNFGDGNISHLESPTHLYSSYKDYNVTLKLTLNDTNNSTLETSKLISFKERALNIKKGWNLLSVPTKDDINTSSFPSSFKFWVYQEDGNWSINPNLIEPPKGFWINADREYKYPYTGEPYALQNFHIKKAWNLLGSGEKISLDKNLTVWHYYGDNGWWYEGSQVDVGEGVWVGKPTTTSSPGGSSTTFSTSGGLCGASTTSSGGTTASFGNTATMTGFSRPTQTACTANGGRWNAATNECYATWDNANKICAMPTKDQWLSVFASCGANTTISTHGGYYSGMVSGICSCMANKGFVDILSAEYWSSDSYNSDFAWGAIIWNGNGWGALWYNKESAYCVRCAN